MTIKQINPPDLTDVLDNLKRDVFVGMHCVKIGIIEEFDATKQLATIRIAFKKVTKVSTDGTRTIREYPLILECPVFVLHGGASHITFPIAVGDNCIVLFSDRELDNWLANGGVQLPTTSRAHDISDAIALVGLHSVNSAIADYLTNGTEWQYNATTRIVITEDKIDCYDDLLEQHGHLLVHGNITIDGDWYGGTGDLITIQSNVTQIPGKTLEAGNGATGTFTTTDMKTVTVVKGIVTSIV